MPSLTLVDRLLEVADTLRESLPQSAAFRRRAVSTAYYAVFHSLAKLCCETLLPNTMRSDDAWQRVYRALDHGSLRRVLQQSPLRSHPVLGVIGPLVIRLQEERHRADYLPPQRDLYSPEEVTDLLGQARYVISELNKLDIGGRKLLATSLLFKERNP
ncbi:MAG TPA: hypothetical protein PKE65_09760 [Rhizobiaceae bacterium]|nr:hypothetical protein [Rhizobiaceae bacterium]